MASSRIRLSTIFIYAGWRAMILDPPPPPPPPPLLRVLNLVAAITIPFTPYPMIYIHRITSIHRKHLPKFTWNLKKILGERNHRVLRTTLQLVSLPWSLFSFFLFFSLPSLTKWLGLCLCTLQYQRSEVKIRNNWRYCCHRQAFSIAISHENHIKEDSKSVQTPINGVNGPTDGRKDRNSLP